MACPCSPVSSGIWSARSRGFPRIRDCAAGSGPRLIRSLSSSTHGRAPPTHSRRPIAAHGSTVADSRASYDAWHAAVGGRAALDTPWHRMVQDALDVRRDLAGKRVLEIVCGRGDFAMWGASVPVPTALLVASAFSAVGVRGA